MKKRLIALTLAVMLLATALPVMAAEEAPAALVTFGIINGYPDGSFQGENTLTRAEAATMMAKAAILAGETDTVFPDTADHWAKQYIGLCADAGILVGYEDGTFLPDNQVTTFEFALMCQRLCGHEADGFVNEGIDRSAFITRSAAAEMLWEAMQSAIGDYQGTLYTTHVVKGILETKALQGFVLAGHVTENQINLTKLNETVTTYLWDRGVWATPEDVTVEDNYVALYDLDDDALADTILVVDKVWSNVYWDGTAMADFQGHYNVPYGQRQIKLGLGGAADDFSNIVETGDLENSTFWPTYDWFNSTSTETFTYLTHFPTSQQTTGWACGTTSALMALNWYNKTSNAHWFNEIDLSTLRDKVNANGDWVWGGYTDTQMLINMFENINDMYDYDLFAWESTYDFVDEDSEFDYDTYLSTDWIIEHLSAGHPILVGWNSFGGHWQVIIGYDTMGTEGTADDVLILADPYDSTDHLNDGYNIQSYERLYWEWSQNFDRDFGADDGYGMPVVFVPYPVEVDPAFAYAPIMGDGLVVKAGAVWSRTGNLTDDMLIPYGDTAADLEASEYKYAKEQRGENGLAGPASSDWFRKGDVVGTPYYAGLDFYNGTSVTETLDLLPAFKTAQQASEWTCGPATLRMVMNHFNSENLPSEFALSALRDNDKEGATTLDGMTQILTGLNAAGGDWAWVTTDDLDDDWNIAGTEHNLEGDFVQHCIANGIPVIIGWDEWGGHWMAIIGFDDMGTEGTQDDVIILADPYDTTDHCQDGYVIESWERLLYGWGAAFDERGSEVFLAFAPTAQMATAGFIAE